MRWVVIAKVYLPYDDDSVLCAFFNLSSKRYWALGMSTHDHLPYPFDLEEFKIALATRVLLEK